MCPVSLAEYTESQQRSAQRALDTLDRLDSRLDAHFAGMRRHPRRLFRGMATVRFPGGGNGATGEFTVWTRSISASGLSFICPNPIAEPWVLVGLEPAPGEVVWFFADIVRRKEVAGEGFWEHGVAFRGRVRD